MIVLAQSRHHIDELDDYGSDSYSRESPDLEDLFMKATVENRPLILRCYIRHPGGLGKSRETRTIQGFFGSPLLSNLFVQSLKPFPAIRRWLILQTHGEPY